MHDYRRVTNEKTFYLDMNGDVEGCTANYIRKSDDLHHIGGWVPSTHEYTHNMPMFRVVQGSHCFHNKKTGDVIEMKAQTFNYVGEFPSVSRGGFGPRVQWSGSIQLLGYQILIHIRS